MTDDSRLDRLLDAALESYSTVEPRADLVEQILSRARHAPSPAVLRRPWLWSSASAIAASALLAFLLHHSTPPQQQETPSETTRLDAPHIQSRPSPKITRKPSPPMPSARTASVTSNRRMAEPQGARPLPLAYSSEELVMIAFVQKHPQEAREVLEAQLRDPDRPPTKPLVIAPLQVQPLSTESNN